jgi:hypothetical protein
MGGSPGANDIGTDAMPVAMPPLSWGLLVLVLAVVATGIAALWFMPLASRNQPGGPEIPAPAIPACGPAPSLAGPGSPVAAGQDRMIGEVMNNNSNPYGGPIPQTRITAWSQSNSTYYLYIMDQSEYDALGTSNTSTGAGNATPVGPAQSFLWSSGPVTSTNHTVLVGNGDWYTVIYNPGTAVVYVNVAVGNCNPP